MFDPEWVIYIPFPVLKKHGGWGRKNVRAREQRDVQK